MLRVRVRVRVSVRVKIKVRVSSMSRACSVRHSVTLDAPIKLPIRVRHIWRA